MAVKAVNIGLCLLLALFAGQAAAQGNLSEYLDRPELTPFIRVVLGIPECFNDPGLYKFEIAQCPSLLRMLDALHLGNTNPTVSCEMSCVQQFAKLNATCTQELMDKFSALEGDVGRLTTEFFETCDELVQGEQQQAGSPGPAPVPAPAPAVAPTPVEAPVAAPIVPSPAPAPAPQPATSGSMAAVLPAALLSLLAAAAAVLAL